MPLQATQPGLARAQQAPLATFVIPHTWPEIRNAEYEILQRMAIAARTIGATMIAVDNDGRPLWSSSDLSLDKAERVDASTVDFMISLHFESPRLIDVHSYYALWQPLDFYHTFGYQPSIEKVLSHIDCLSCGSAPADAHARNAFNAGRPPTDLPFARLYHSPPGPYYAPDIGAHSRPFYIGINWERVNGQKGRHQQVLQLLDEDGLIDIYGPREFLGVKPWDGFKCYRGELPFDGRSVVRAQNRSGICLALSSESHKRSALMSNRLFEGLAAGAAIISDPHPFVREHFGDLAYFVDDTGGQDDLYYQIRTVVEDIRRNPEPAIERALKGQQRLAEKFSLEGCLKAIIEEHPRRRTAHVRAHLSEASVTVIVVYAGNSLTEALALLDCALRQKAVAVHVALVCDSTFHDRHEAALSAAVAGRAKSFTSHTRRLSITEAVAGALPSRVEGRGPAVAAALANVKTEYFCFLLEGESWFEDHLGALASAIARTPGATMAASGAIAETRSSDRAATRSLDGIHAKMPESDLIAGRYDADGGRFLFARSVVHSLPRDCFDVLDGQEHNLVRLAAGLAGALAQSTFATYVRKEGDIARRPRPVIPVSEQQQYIRDAFAASPAWRDRAVASAPQTTPSVWDRFAHIPGVTSRLPLNMLVKTQAEGEGLRYLYEGFSKPEKDHIWVEGDTAVIEFSCDGAALAEAGDLDLVLYMLGRPAAGSGRAQHCTVSINGLAIAYVEAPETETRITLRLPPSIRNAGDRMRLTITTDHAEPVYDDKDRILDARKLSVQLRRIGLFGARRTDRPLLAPNTLHATTLRGDGRECLADGFADPEGNGAWIVGRRATLRLRTGQSEATLCLHLVGRKSRTGTPQRVTATVNGVAFARQDLPEEPFALELPLSASLVDLDGGCNVALAFDHAEPVLDEDGEVQDPRMLAALLLGVEVRVANAIPVGPEQFPALAMTTLHETRTASPALAALAAGFSAPEPNGVWIEGPTAQINLQLDASALPLRLRLHLLGRASRFGAEQQVSVTVNNTAVASATLTESIGAVEVPLPKGAVGEDGRCRIRLTFAHAEPVTDRAGATVDSRRLAAFLAAFELIPAQHSRASSLTNPARVARTLLGKAWPR